MQACIPIGKQLLSLGAANLCLESERPIFTVIPSKSFPLTTGSCTLHDNASYIVNGGCMDQNIEYLEGSRRGKHTRGRYMVVGVG
jgi:hypothetical protein